MAQPTWAGLARGACIEIDDARGGELEYLAALRARLTDLVGADGCRALVARATQLAERDQCHLDPDVGVLEQLVPLVEDLLGRDLVVDLRLTTAAT